MVGGGGPDQGRHASLASKVVRRPLGVAFAVTAVVAFVSWPPERVSQADRLVPRVVVRGVRRARGHAATRASSDPVAGAAPAQPRVPGVAPSPVRDIALRWQSAISHPSSKRGERECYRHYLDARSGRGHAARKSGRRSEPAGSDRTLRGHRTGAYSELVAEEFGLDRGAREGLRWAGLMHDVGKLAIPSAVLNKAGPLSPSEWTLIRRHPEIGAGLCAPLAPRLGSAAGVLGPP